MTAMTTLPTVTIRGRVYTVSVWGSTNMPYVLTSPRGVRYDVFRIKASPVGRMFARHAVNGRLMSGVALYDRNGVVTAEVDES